ncbi:Uncharacterised protein [Klebsiella pneumoniae]|nr:Uncharacterised protein [Klebsiella pneumoniae]
MPIPMAKKMPHSSGRGATSATDTAVPRNGAVQGVASRVAKAPCQKWPIKPLPPRVARKVLALEERRISNSPNKLALNSTITSAIAPINHGFWNWMPQPSA